MNKFLSPHVSKSAFNVATLVLRIFMGVVMIPGHGWKKLMNFTEIEPNFINFLGLGTTVSLGLATFAELVCAILIILGLFTRFAAVPLIITMAVAVSIGMSWDVFDTGQLPTLFFGGFIVILLLGPGEYSLDALLFKDIK